MGSFFKTMKPGSLKSDILLCLNIIRQIACGAAFLAVCMLISPTAWAQDSDAKVLDREFRSTVIPFLNTYCLDCHGRDRQEAKLNLGGFTTAGKVVWEFSAGGSQSYGVRRLPNGNTLICDSATGKVVEVTPGKKIVWVFSEPTVCDAFRLPSGNTLLTSGRRFAEVTPDKKVVWSKDGASYGTARK